MNPFVDQSREALPDATLQNLRVDRCKVGWLLADCDEWVSFGDACELSFAWHDFPISSGAMRQHSRC